MNWCFFLNLMTLGQSLTYLILFPIKPIRVVSAEYGKKDITSGELMKLPTCIIRYNGTGSNGRLKNMIMVIHDFS